MKISTFSGLVICFFLCFLASAQGEYVIHQKESPHMFDMATEGERVFLRFQHDHNGIWESFLVRGDKSMLNRDTIKFSTLAQINLH
ncbi:hypothetical protein [Owenweeksia hongkongensis]|uniref:hypothetical protein n=1 Tax=Owenweeksia hongkongensis TaxID=253245 RepID=UPI003A956A14